VFVELQDRRKPNKRLRRKNLEVMAKKRI